MALNKGFSFVLAAFQDDESVSRGKIRPRDSGASLRARRSSLETIGDRSLDESRSIVSRVVVTANLYFGFILGDYKHARPPFRRTRARARARPLLTRNIFAAFPARALRTGFMLVVHLPARFKF